MKLELVIRKEVAFIELKRDEKHCLGISVKDGKEGEAGPIIKRVRSKSLAARSFAVAKGDVVLSVNGCSTAGAKSKDVKRILKKAGPAIIDLQLLYETQEARIFGHNVYRKQRLTIKLKKVNGSFGFLLRKKLSKHSFSMEYPVVSNIKEGSPAHKSGQLQDGDLLIMVDDVNLSWLSLPYISSLLLEKDEADFTFEYNIAVVGFTDDETKIDFEINAPVEDIGVILRARDEDPAALYVSSIRQGSVAERCGIFSEGDTIISVNDVAAKEMTAAEANSLLTGTKRGRRMSFIANRRKEQDADIHSDDSSSTQDERITMESCSSYSYVADWRHVNTPVSSSFILSAQQSCNFQRFCYSEHFKSMENFQSLLSVMSSLKQSLSALTRQASDGTRNRLNQNCTACNVTQHTVKLCYSCLSRMNVKCAQSMEVLRKMVAHIVRLTTENVDENQSFSVSVRNVIHTLTEILPNVLRVPELQEQFGILADKLANADTSCSTCDFEVKSVVIIVQQLLLVLSIKDNSEEFIELIEHLVSCLLEIRFTCYEVSEHMVTTEDSARSSLSISVDDDSSSQSSSVGLINNSETESYCVCDSTDSLLNIPESKTVPNSDFFKLTHIQSLSESRKSVSTDFLESTSASDTNLIKNCDTVLDDRRKSSSLVAIAAKGTSSSTFMKIRESIKAFRLWRSLDSFIKFKKSTGVQSITKVLEESESAVTSFTEVNPPNTPVSSRTVRSHSLPEPATSHNYENIPNKESSSTSSSSSSTHRTKSEVPVENKKTHSETIKVKLSNAGEGFGLEIGFCDRSTPSVVVIKAILPKSPAKKSGVLKEGDRILAVNNRSTRTLSNTQLQSLKRRAFSADTVSLLVEIDIIDEEYKFGIFDVVLDRVLRIGLIFEDMQDAHPVVIKSIVKGSGAHRCGQLFTGDRLTFFRCTRKEEYDPVSLSYNREEKVIVTVQREPPKVVPGVLESATSFPCYVNPCFQHEDSCSRDGSDFVVKSTAIRSVDGKDYLVVEHEVTLFRDSSSCDFGILLAQDPKTKRAYVADVRPNSPAHRSGVIQKLDRIVKVNGVMVDVENPVLDLFSKAKSNVDLLVQRNKKYKKK